MASTWPESLAPYFYGADTKGPSPVMCHTTKKVWQEMTVEDIQRMVVEFGEGARRAAVVNPGSRQATTRPSGTIEIQRLIGPPAARG